MKKNNKTGFSGMVFAQSVSQSVSQMLFNKKIGCESTALNFFKNKKLINVCFFKNLF
jgi:hypothetical protein